MVSNESNPKDIGLGKAMHGSSLKDWSQVVFYQHMWI